jgi:hypothetical protein
MKAEIKTRIKQLRNEGYGYKRIAKTLDLTLSVVRYACNKLNEEELLGGSCEQCHVKLKSIKGRKEKRFCSDKCRWKWWNQHHDELKKRAYYTHTYYPSNQQKA